MRIIWSQEAETDLEEAFSHISSENPKAALDLFYRVKNKVEMLSSQPAMGRPGRVPNTRELVITKTQFIVPYRLVNQKNQIEIIRVFHTAREFPDSF